MDKKNNNENDGDDDKIELYYTIIINDCLTYKTHVVTFGRVDLKKKDETGQVINENKRSQQ